MDRKVALATAAAVVLTVSAGTAAVGANLGLLSATEDDTVGQLQPARSVELPTRPLDDSYEDDDTYKEDVDVDVDDDEDEDDGRDDDD